MLKSTTKLLVAAAVGVSLGASGYAFAAVVHDWRDLFKVHEHVVESIHEMERARAANHYDMGGHGLKAEELLHQVEHELNLAIEDAKKS